MKLNQELFERIVDLLHPHMDEDNRHTLITPVFFAYDPLYSQIKWSGNNRAFSTKLVVQLANYGRMESGEVALSLLLKALGSQVGLDNQQEVEEVLQQLESVQSTGTTNWKIAAQTNYPRKKNRDPWGCSISVVMGSMITILLVLLISMNHTIHTPTLQNPFSWKIVTHTPAPRTIPTKRSIPSPSPLPTVTFAPPPMNTDAPLPTIPAAIFLTVEASGEVIQGVPRVPTPLPPWTPTSTIPITTQITTETSGDTIPIIPTRFPTLPPEATPTPTKARILSFTATPLTPETSGEAIPSTPMELPTLRPTGIPAPAKAIPTAPVDITSTVTPTDTAILDTSNLPTPIGITHPIEPLSTTSLPPIDNTNVIEIREQSNVIEVPQDSE